MQTVLTGTEQGKKKALFYNWISALTLKVNNTNKMSLLNNKVNKSLNLYVLPVRFLSYIKKRQETDTWETL